MPLSQKRREPIGSAGHGFESFWMCIPKKERGIGDWAEAVALSNDIPSSVQSRSSAVNILSSLFFYSLSDEGLCRVLMPRAISFLYRDEAFREKEKPLAHDPRIRKQFAHLPGG